MSKNKTLTIILSLFLVVIVLFTIVKYAVIGKGILVSPGLVKTVEKVVNQPTPQPSIPSYNPPKEIKYGSSTDLKLELEKINPQVLDSDFE